MPAAEHQAMTCGLGKPPDHAFARLLCVVTAAVLGVSARATDFYVNGTFGNDAWNGQCQFWNGGLCGPKATITAALSAARAGDTIWVADGVYTGEGNTNIVFGGRDLTLRSENGPESCILDGLDAVPILRFMNGESRFAVLDGFTLQHGSSSFGSALRCQFAHPTIQNCVIRHSHASTNGAGLHCWGSNPTVVNCRFENNTAAGHGGAVYAYISNVAFLDCTFEANASGLDGGAIYTLYGNPAVVNACICGNQAGGFGGGVYAQFNSILLGHCVLTGNRAGRGGGAYLRNPFATVANCTIHGNRALTDGGGIVACYSGTARVWNSLLWGNEAPAGAQLTVDQQTILYVAYTALAGGVPGIYVTGGGGLNVGGGMLAGAPAVVAPGYWDDAGTPENPADDIWISGDYHLVAGSLGIDAGDRDSVPHDVFDLDQDDDVSEPQPFDMDGTPRFLNDPDTPDTGPGPPPVCDMGAFEFSSDCNENGTPDHLDIANGWSLDLNANTIPDECETMLMIVSMSPCGMDVLEVEIVMEHPEAVIVGGQFFLQWDTSRLALLSVEPGDAEGTDPDNPFEREIFEAVDHNAGHIDYLVGIPDGESGSAADLPVVRARFAVLSDQCNAAPVLSFRVHIPRTRLAGELGLPITPDPVDLLPIVLDTQPPDLTPPPDVAILACASTDPGHTGQAIATDNCDPAPLVSYDDEVVGDAIWRTWSATDACGHVVSAVQIITLRDPAAWGDLDGDCDVDWIDFQVFAICISGPDNPPEPGCEPSDLDGDGDVDLADFARMQQAFTGASP